MSTTIHTPDAESNDEQQSSASAAVERVESLVHYGRPTCDVCYDQLSGEREGAFWPSNPVRYVAVDERVLVDFSVATVCDVHDDPEQYPDATHRLETSVEYIGDEHRMNSAYRSHVDAVDELENE